MTAYNITIFKNGALYEEFISKEALKSHKVAQAKNCIVGEAMQCSTLEEVLQIAAIYPTTFSALKDNKRSAANLITTNLAVIDIDDSFNIEQTTDILKAANLKFGLYTSFSHQTEGKDKFHVILELGEIVNNAEVYKTTYEEICKLFDHKNDGQPSSPANLFFNSNELAQELIYHDGAAFQVKYPAKEARHVEKYETNPTESAGGKLTNRSLNFLVNGAAEGEWHSERNYVAKNMKAAGYSMLDCMEKIKRITGSLDSTDRYQIKYAYENTGFEHSTPLTVLNSHPLREMYKTDAGKNTRIPVKEVVLVWLKDNFVTTTFTEQFYLEGRYLPLDAIIEDIRNFSESKLQQQSPSIVIGSVLSRHLIDTREARFKELRDHIKFDESAHVDLNSLMTSVIESPDEVIKSIVMHFMWQVKRKMFDKPVTYHMMPVFVGPSGSGKSIFISKLLAPIADMAHLDGDFKKLVDSREAFTLINNYVYFMDEMSKADTADVETIKNRVTSSVIQYRKLGTNSTISGPNNATFIGASNTELRFIIKDPTSARRFFEVVTPRRMDWKVVEQFDYLSLWRSIDEKKEEPYIMPFMDEIASRQALTKYKAPLEEFINDVELSNKKTHKDQISGSRRELFELYQFWCNRNGYKFGLTFHNFSASLKSHLGDIFSTTVSGNSVRVYFYNKEVVTTHLKIVE